MPCCVAMVAKSLDLNKLWSCKYGRKKEENDDIYGFPVLDGTKR